MREAIDNHEFTGNDKYKAKLGGLNLWIENQPYASWRPYEKGVEYHYLPSRRTVILLERKFAAYQEAIIKETLNRK